MENAFIVLTVAALVELGRRANARDWNAVVTIIGAALVGGLAGALNLAGVPSIEAGVVAGLTASGLVTVASKVG